MGNLAERVIPIAQEKGAMMWKGGAMLNKGCVFTLTSSSDDRNAHCRNVDMVFHGSNNLAAVISSVFG